VRILRVILWKGRGDLTSGKTCTNNGGGKPAKGVSVNREKVTQGTREKGKRISHREPKKFFDRKSRTEKRARKGNCAATGENAEGIREAP